MSPYIWLGVAVAMAVVEAVSLSLITIWFVAGGLVAFIAGFFGADLAVQVIAFLAVSLACLALFRPLIVKHRAIGESHEATMVGREAVVVEPISAHSPGRVETPDRVSWIALAAGGESIEVGAHVRVVGQESIKLVVERV